MNLLSNPLKKKLKSGEQVIGSWITMAHPAVVDIMCKRKWDYLVIDLEHSDITLDKLIWMISMIEKHDIVPLVRLSSIDAVQAKRVLDMGAYGLVFPMVNNSDEADMALLSMTYPPKGSRSYGLARAQNYGKDPEPYFHQANDQLVRIFQIESAEAVNNIDTILGFNPDAVMIGPYDLSGSLGMPGEFLSDKYVEATICIHDACDTAGIPRGYHVVHPDPEQLGYAKSNNKLIAYGADFTFLDTAVRE